MSKNPDNSRACILVIGLGKTGYSIIEHYADQDVHLTVADSRDLAPNLARVRATYPGVEVISGRIPVDRFDEFDRIVASPGIAVPSCDNLVGDIELFVESADAPIIAITGSNGKSTVTTLVTLLLQAGGRRVSTGGNIGTPALDLLRNETPDYYVLELSSFQLDNTRSLAAAAATVLNVSEDHMDRYGCFADYVQSKARVLSGAGCRVLNRDDPELDSLRQADPDAITFGLGAPPRERDFGVAEHAGEAWLCRGEEPLAPVAGLTLQGEQNVANVLAAMALVAGAGTKLEPAVVAAALGFRGLEHRCELVASIDGVRWINDSKGTNVGATVAAIKGFGENIVLIAGGIGKGADFTPLAAAISERVSAVVLFGQDASLIEEAVGTAAPVSRARDLGEAVDLAAALAAPGGVVLFSPACSSFDMFENFERRGQAFKRLVADREARR